MISHWELLLHTAGVQCHILPWSPEFPAAPLFLPIVKKKELVINKSRRGNNK